MKKETYLNKCYLLNKYMVNTKIKVTISLRRELWEKYQRHCKEHDLTPSYEIQKFMKKQIGGK